MNNSFNWRRPSEKKRCFEEEIVSLEKRFLEPSKTSPSSKRRHALQRTVSIKQYPSCARKLDNTFCSTASLRDSNRLSVSSLSLSTSIMDDQSLLEDSWLDTANATLPLVDNRMRVFARIRPMNSVESNSRRIVEVLDDQVLVFDPPSEDYSQDYSQWESRTPGRKQNKNFRFRFDKVFDDNSSNYDVFEAVTKNLIQSFLDGYNCAVFAYGATGSGKTYTMLGRKENPGVIFLTIMELFRLFESRSRDDEMNISISYFEIYNEFVYDLLTTQSGKHMIVQEDPKRGVTIRNLSVHEPRNADHLLEMLHEGNKNRSQHPTDANAESSRSHAIFQVFLRKRDVNQMSIGQETVAFSKMSLIDLAGSERASVSCRTSSKKSLQREGSNINKSLLALGNCINALSRKRSSHIPYRDSKLTLLLRDSLGGSCKTAMIAVASPSSLSYEDTHNTLIYANRAKGIQINPTKNLISTSLKSHDFSKAIDTMTRKMSNLEEENNRLKSELEKLKTVQTFSCLPLAEESLEAEGEVKTKCTEKTETKIEQEKINASTIEETLVLEEPAKNSKKRKLDPRETLKEMSNKLFKAYSWYHRL